MVVRERGLTGLLATYKNFGCVRGGGEYLRVCVMCATDRYRLGSSDSDKCDCSLIDRNTLFSTGASPKPIIRTNAKIMLATALCYVLIQGEQPTRRPTG